MKLLIKRNNIIIVPEDDLERSFIEDTLKLKNNGDEIKTARINDVNLGFGDSSNFVIKIGN